MGAKTYYRWLRQVCIAFADRYLASCDTTNPCYREYHRRGMSPQAAIKAYIVDHIPLAKYELAGRN